MSDKVQSNEIYTNVAQVHQILDVTVQIVIIILASHFMFYINNATEFSLYGPWALKYISLGKGSSPSIQIQIYTRSTNDFERKGFYKTMKTASIDR